MIRRCVPFLILLIAGMPAAAQPPVEPIRLTIHPAAAPVPALKYRLMPEVRELTPGNAAFLYHRAHSPEWMGHRRQPDYYKKIDEWLQKPLKELPRDEIRTLLPRGAQEELALAARREYCDWELTPRVRKDGVALLLPELQGFREFANFLSLRARVEMAEGDYTQAVRTLETGFAMGRHVGEAPILINALVGMAILQVMTARAEELIQLPDGPNLYWALTALPRPLVDMRKPLQGERLFVDTIFPGIREALADAKSSPMTAEQVRKMVGMLTSSLSLFDGQSHKDWTNSLAIAALAARAYPEAKQFLIKQGRTAEQVEAMPLLQAVVMFEVANFDRVYDDMLKWQGLPFWETRTGLQQAEKQLKEAKAHNSVGMTLATLLMPAVMKVHEASARSDRRVAMVRCVEAVRLYAAAHEGKLPAALTDIREVPLPIDPYTGKPFDYQADGDQATLIAPPPPGEKAGPHNSMRYELTLKRK